MFSSPTFFYKNVFGIHCFILAFVYLIHYLFDIFFTNFFSNNVFNLISYISNLVNSFISYIFSFSSVKGNCDFLVAIIVIAGVYLKDFFIIKIFKAFFRLFYFLHIKLTNCSTGNCCRTYYFLKESHSYILHFGKLLR